MQISCGEVSVEDSEKELNAALPTTRMEEEKGRRGMVSVAIWCRHNCNNTWRIELPIPTSKVYTAASLSLLSSNVSFG
jgi:hypothetical protein